LLTGFHPALRDERIKAVISIAGLSSFFAKGFYHTREIPILFIHGDIDAFVDYQLHARRSFERAAPNARLVTIANATHAAFAIQFDPSTVALLNALLGLPNAHPSNPDGFGCGSVGESLGTSAGSFTAQLGGPASFIEYDPVNEPLAPCRGDEYTRPAMDALKQVELSVRAGIAFFDAHLGATPTVRHDGCRYLLHELPKQPAVSVE
jgi:hypothetical protein